MYIHKIIIMKILFIALTGTVLQKTKELFNISTTDECRLWYWDDQYKTLSDDSLEETLIDAIININDNMVI